MQMELVLLARPYPASRDQLLCKPLCTIQDLKDITPPLHDLVTPGFSNFPSSPNEALAGPCGPLNSLTFVSFFSTFAKSATCIHPSHLSRLILLVKLSPVLTGQGGKTTHLSHPSKHILLQCVIAALPSKGRVYLSRR